MRKSVLQNAPISDIISRMGHGDGICVGDAGLPIPAGTERIDLAVRRHLPGMLDVAETIGGELQIERVLIAKEMVEQQPDYHAEVMAFIARIADAQGTDIAVATTSHDDFKKETASCKAVVRTGECTPYANVIFYAGVSF
ncbi:MULTISPECIES: D-ribose pyranase [Pseudovibrio]|uniref:D-ribose pyranase n=1 Tax=Stappiaceae TaxID=2821832 RepID=UPI0023663C85|nr:MULTISPECIES: D-ribose pyranase [Pseudovibrio]MDD7910831.1 D-ribose pyranase [Pseudovibrio exalbescens]MDX5593460.1 D-ribose pyranase [Pseudovibrio sp. SPO723]